MKASDYKQFLTNNWRNGHARFLKILAIAIFFFLPLASCEKGELGDPGLAFVAFTWVEHEPDYIEIANDFIPALFYWDWYYRVDPGIYYVYYEGEFRRSPYAWELEYEVWENEGKRGKHSWIKGTDGPDAYFTIELSPFGPEVIYEEIYPDKSGTDGKAELIIPEIGSSFTVEQQCNDYRLRVTYRRIESRGR